jgi:hypothetical protein
MDAQSRDEQLAGEQRPSEVKPNFKRPEVVGLVPLWMYALRAYTVCLKNLENIAKNKKEEHLQRILEGWSTVMLYACIVFTEIVEKREIQLGPVKFVFSQPQNMDARFCGLCSPTFQCLCPIGSAATLGHKSSRSN